MEDINTPDAPTVACAKLNAIIDVNGRRSSTFDAFLPISVALGRKDRLKICTHTVVSSLHIQNNKACGIFFEPEDPNERQGKPFYACARREVVVCCGTIASPQLLMLRYKLARFMYDFSLHLDSGIGPASHLKSLDINVVKDLPGVGSNLVRHSAKIFRLVLNCETARPLRGRDDVSHRAQGLIPHRSRQSAPRTFRILQIPDPRNRPISVPHY